MATITDTDLAAVLGKMTEGEFIMVLVVKGGPTQGADEVITYPKDGTPMPEDDVQATLGGFLKQCPVPLDERPNEEGNAYLNADADGEPLPLYSKLGWLATYIRDLIKGQATRGLQKIEAESATNPMPE